MNPSDPNHAPAPTLVTGNESCTDDDDNPVGHIALPRPSGRCARAMVMAGFTLAAGVAWIAAAGTTEPQTTTLL
jgi:hypothetical protein